MSNTLGPRQQETLAAAARILVPVGGSLELGADDLQLARKIADEVATYPRFARRQVKLLLFAVQHYPLISGYSRRFRRLPSDKQAEFLDRMAHHKRSALRRLVLAYIKQMVYGMYVSQPEVEAAVGYRYECARPRGHAAAPEDQIHH